MKALLARIAALLIVIVGLYAFLDDPFNRPAAPSSFAGDMRITSDVAKIASHKQETEQLPPPLSQDFCNALIQKSHIENFNDGQDVSEYTSAGTCKISIGKGISFIFSFENHSQSNEPEFVLNVYSTEGRIIQTLPVAYPWQFDVNTINLHDDINFDGYKDLLLRESSPRAAEFTYYLYNPQKKRFVANETLFHIFSPTFNPTTKTIRATPDIPSYYADAAGEQRYYRPEEQTTEFEFKNGLYVQNEEP